jgi:deoxyribodipyrimidine photolyase-related protein
VGSVPLGGYRMSTLWLFGDQLGPHFHRALEVRGHRVLLVESAAALGRHRYHRQKLHLVLAGMRNLADELGDRATYVRAATYREAVENAGEPVTVFQPHSRAAANLVERLRADGLVAEVLPTPGFALSTADFADWARERTHFRMEDFYRAQRKRFDILMDGSEPVGGKWNYDHDNREPPPKGSRILDVPAAYAPRESVVDEQVRADLDAMVRAGEIDPVGVDGPRRFPVTRAEALRALSRFTEHRLATFGPHQDAMLGADWAMSHSLLSVAMNHGLLDPLEVVHAAEQAHRDGDAPLSSVEGFIRQVLGWREYVWHLYWHLGAEYLHRNELHAKTPLPAWWRDLDPDGVDGECLSTALAEVRDRGYAHHIERLMVLGNHALQRGYRPAELTRWFATAFVDGFPWVMPVNVIGMSQHADGGVIASKPYAAGGAYVNRMSDYCGRCRYDPKTRLGPDACPFTAGYWFWLAGHAGALQGNRRMAQPLASARRLADLDAVRAQEHDRDRF